MKKIQLHCKTIKQAERVQNSLYERYSEVNLIGWPLFDEGGLYVWAVEGKIE